MPLPNYNPGVEQRQVTTRRTDTYFRVNTPELPAPDTSGSARLAQSLGVGARTIGNAIKRIGAADDKISEEQAEQEAIQRFAKQGYENLKQQRADGTMYPSDDPFLAMAMERQFGLRTVRNMREDIGRRLQPGHSDSFDYATLDVEKTIQEYVGKATEGLGENKFAIGGFSDEFERTEQSLRNALKVGKSKYLTDEAQGQVFENLWEISTAGLTQGLPPAEVQAQMRVAAKGMSEVYGLSPAHMDEIVLDLTASLAATENGSYGLVKMLLTGDRDGVGPIAGKRKLAAKAVSILEASRKKNVEATQAAHFDTITGVLSTVDDGQFGEEQAKAVREKHPDLFTDTRLQSLVRQSTRRAETLRKAQATEEAKASAARNHTKDLARISDFLSQTGKAGDLSSLVKPIKYRSATGKIIEMSVKEQQEVAVQETLTRTSKLPPEERLPAELQWFSANGIVHPQWRSVMRSGFIGASFDNVDVASITDNPDSNWRKAQTLYDTLHTKNPNFVKNLGVSSDALDFYESVRVLRKYGSAETDAIRMTLDAEKHLSSTSGASQRMAIRKLHEHLDKVAEQDNGWFSGERTQNMGAVGHALERLSELHVRRGLSPEAAFEFAQSQFSRVHQPINGWQTYVGDVTTPANFAEMTESYLANFAENNKLDVDDLTISNIGNAATRWRVILKSNALAPVSDTAKTEGLVFNLSDLRTFASKARAARKAALLDEINTKHTGDTKRGRLAHTHPVQGEGPDLTKPRHNRRGNTQ